MSFNFETEDFRNSLNGASSGQDECFMHTHTTKTESFRDTVECRCPGYRNFSILTKFKFDNVNAAVTLLKIGDNNGEPQLRLTIDNCAKKLVMYLNEGGEGCGYNGTTLEFPLTQFKANEWQKLSIEFSESEVSLYHNCVLLRSQVKSLNRSGCQLQCTNSTFNKIAGSVEKSNCSNRGIAVSIVY